MKTTDQFLGKYTGTYDFDKPIEEKFLPDSIYGSTDDKRHFFIKCQKIKEICEEFNLSAYNSDFQRLYNAAARINYLSNNVSHIFGDLRTFEYRNQLYSAFKVFHLAKQSNNVVIDYINIGFRKPKPHIGTRDSMETDHLNIKDNHLLNELGDLFMNEVSTLYFDKTYKELSDAEIDSLLSKIEKWFELVKVKEKGGGLKRGYFLKLFANDIFDYINENALLINETKTHKFEFIGKLFEAYDLKSPTMCTSYSKMMFNIINAKD